MSQNSYLRKFLRLMSQIVFPADFTVLGLITTALAETSKSSFLREFCAQVSQILFLAELTVFMAYYNCMSNNVTKLISRRVLCTSITNRFPS